MFIELDGLGGLYEITMTEYDDGVQRPMGKKFVTEEHEAIWVCDQYASGNPQCYYRASYRKIY